MISWHRYYDPATGRYISADPIGLDGGTNLYAYVNGNPVNAVDPMGLKAGVSDEAGYLITHMKSIKKAYDKAKEGKMSGCICIDSVTRSYCECMVKHKFKPKEIAACVCMTSSNASKCEKDFLDWFPTIQ